MDHGLTIAALGVCINLPKFSTPSSSIGWEAKLSASLSHAGAL
jgi:hypothetical protein